MTLALGSAVAIIGSALLLLHPSPCSAQTDAPTEPADFFRRMASAGEATYQARQLVVYFGRPQSAAVVDLRSSSAGHFLRAESGSDVTRLWSRGDTRLVSEATGTITEASPSTLRLDPDAVLAKFDVEVERPASLLGVRVVPLSLVRRSDNVAVERLWVHAESGVVYRRELYGAGGKLVGLAAILDMRWGRDEPAEPFDPGAGTVSRALAAPSEDAPRMLPNGYRLQRGYRLTVEDHPTEHWLYSDGLHALSIFRTPGGMRAPEGFTETDVGSARGWAGPGPGTWAWEGGGASWVIVAEESSLDPARITGPLPKGGPSTWARMGSLWSGAFRAIGDLFS